MACLALAAAAFVGTHFLLVASAARSRSLPRMGEGPFQGLYSLVALATFGADDLGLRAASAISRHFGTQARRAGSSRRLLMWLGSILLRRLLLRQPGTAGRPARARQGAGGVFAITRHPMMWGFALWAIVHIIVVATPKALLFDGAILFLALAGSVGQDRKKAELMGERFARMDCADRFRPLRPRLCESGCLRPGWRNHPLPSSQPGCIRCPSGIWRWIG